jgi:hypothetical protein
MGNPVECDAKLKSEKLFSIFPANVLSHENY